MRNCLLLILLILSQFVWGQVNDPLKTEDYEAQSKWVDSVYNRLTLKERIGQLFMVQAFSNKPKSHEKEIENLELNEDKIKDIINEADEEAEEAEYLKNELERDLIEA